MKMKKYLILAIVSFSILIVLWPAQQITGETDLSAKEKKTERNLTALEKLALSYKGVGSGEKEVWQGLEGVLVRKTTLMSSSTIILQQTRRNSRQQKKTRSQKTTKLPSCYCSAWV